MFDTDHPTTNDTIMIWWSGGEAERVVCAGQSLP
jgi:hypothetical protein